MNHAIKARILGRVQGVFFRASTQKQAMKLDLTGWVKNSEEGDVCLEAEGSEQSIEQFITWLNHGPEFAIVEQVIIENNKASNSFKGFEVRY